MYIRKTAYTVIDKSRIWSAAGCHTYTIYNHGNVNVTIGNVLVLRPGQCLSGPPEHPEVQDYSSIDIQFDMANAPKVVQPDTGPYPIERVYTEGDPVPDKDFRVVIIQSFIEKL